MFLFLSARGVLRIHSCSEDFCFQGFLIFFVSHCDICTKLSNRFDVITNWRNISIQNFSLDLRANCSAILVSRLLSVVCIIGLCGLHFSIQVQIENVVFEVDWNQLVLSIPMLQRSRAKDDKISIWDMTVVT